MSAEARCIFLDITRLVARVGIGPLTGIDRVERAYLSALIGRGERFYLLCRTRRGFLILGQEAAPEILAWVDTPETLSVPTFLDRISGHRRSGLEAAIRPLAQALPKLNQLADFLNTIAPAGGVYLNVGHANLEARFLQEISRVPGLNIAVMIHDTIPMDFPEYSGDRAPADFREKLRAVSQSATLIICPSKVVQNDLTRWCSNFGAVPTILIAPLGVAVSPQDQASIPDKMNLRRPYFVALGTIEPRKDHALLLDVWSDFHATTPEKSIPLLHILGRRGWKNEDVFHRLAHDFAIGRTVFEWSGLSDGAVSRILSGSCGLLAPSRAEGFGMPATEAAALGVQVLASDLPVTKEILGDYPIYAPIGDRYAWAKAIRMMADQAQSGMRRPKMAELPSWDKHFSLVFTMI